MVSATESKITAERIRQLFSYDPFSGELVRLVKSKGTSGNIIQSHDLEIDGEKHETSRYIWLHYYGVWPPLDKVVDHENRIRSDNRLLNLRLATYGQNNSNKPSQNQYGCKGIEFRARRKPWVVRIWKDGSRTYIGSYITYEEAVQAYHEAVTEYHGEFACLEQ